MSPSRERRLLKMALALRNRTPSRKARLLRLAILWLITFGLVLYLLQNFGAPVGTELAWVVAAFFGGTVAGALAVVDAGREQWKILAPHIDSASIEARIATLDRAVP